MQTIKRFQFLLFNISNSTYQVYIQNIDNLNTDIWFQKYNFNNNP